MEGKIPLFCFICLGQAIICMKLKDAIPMGTLGMVKSHFQFEQYILRAHQLSQKSTHSLMKWLLITTCKWILFALTSSLV
nr:hypothetical protein Iba_chr04bCG11060 [Ipomoea batatas]GMC90469.1 hypothetical protein Iba_chr04fCG8390 [Ipomoea batatas]